MHKYHVADDSPVTSPGTQAIKSKKNVACMYDNAIDLIVVNFLPSFYLVVMNSVHMSAIINKSRKNSNIFWSSSAAKLKAMTYGKLKKEIM